MKNPKKRIMRALKIDEVSVVDRPAQQGAVMTIMKRDDGVEKAPVQPRARMKPAYDGKSKSSKAVWLSCVEKVRSRDGCDGVTALRTARKEYPSEFAAFAGVAHTNDPYHGMSKGDDEMEKLDGFFPMFEAAVATIQKREGLSMTEAMTQARSSCPVLFAKFQSEGYAQSRAAYAKKAELESPRQARADYSVPRAGRSHRTG